MTNVSTFRMSWRLFESQTSFTSSWFMRPQGNMKKEWIVCPPTFSAARPVGARRTIRLCVFRAK